MEILSISIFYRYFHRYFRVFGLPIFPILPIFNTLPRTQNFELRKIPLLPSFVQLWQSTSLRCTSNSTLDSSDSLRTQPQTCRFHAIDEILWTWWWVSGEPPNALEGIWEAKNVGAYDGDEDVGWIGTTAARSASRAATWDSCFHLALI